jgi:hypothetical protein
VSSIELKIKEKLQASQTDRRPPSDAPLAADHYMPWLSNTFLQAALSFERFRCKHC